ncbi:glycosyltransferase [Streptomyces thermolilacinus]|uniref:D-inositol 3-phosphate glycosyltransferase n=1 Tax=Streptomyces thermolilacinus SPC6 TaxID=1306406 RepID=A0A1D3E0P8_9ACTN|nr:glycosyltransferase [Streptomyces thermolilacinus]OEJ98152.1 glycosyl transferase [Streptomyces thermolilacinus SPC6]
MRVLHAVTLHSPTGAFGGPVRVALNLAHGLRERGHDPRLLALADGSGPVPPTDVEGVPARLYPARRLLPLGFSGITSPALLAAAGRLVRGADVVHVHLARDLVTLPVALAALRARVPLVLQTHGMVDPSDRLLAKVLDAVAVRRVLRGADAVLHLTAHERRGLDAVVGEPLPHAVRLVNGVPRQEARPAPGGPPRILYAARLQARKRPCDFVAAAPEVLRRHPDARFVVAGPDEGELPAVRALIDRLGLRERVECVGALGSAQVLDELRRAHVYVLPSVDEPFPMSVLESLSVGTPAVVTESNGLASAVREAGAGRVVADASGLAGAVLELLEPEVAEKASAAAHALAGSAFSMDAVVDELLAVYGGAADRRRA